MERTKQSPADPVCEGINPVSNRKNDWRWDGSQD
jgi:hypothetical protein